MLTLETLRRDVVRLPVLIKVGLVVMVLAGTADVAAHVMAAEEASHLHEHTPFELAAHLAGLVSMVIIFAGVVLDGVRQGRARRRTSTAAGQGVE